MNDGAGELIENADYDAQTASAGALRIGARINDEPWRETMPTIRCLLAGLLLLAGSLAASANAAELNVLCSGAMRAAIKELAPAFEKASGHKLNLAFATAGKVEEKVAAGDSVDVAIVTKPRMDKLVRSAKVTGGTVISLAQVEIGLAVKKGTPKPDIGSVEAFKRAMLNAKSIAYIDPASGGTSGIHMAAVFEKLGIAGELKPKLRLVSPPPGQSSARAGDTVMRGEAEIAIQPISELQEVEGIEVVGALPAELQTPDLAFMGGASFFTEQPFATKEFLDFLASPAAAAVYKAKGMKPG